MASAIVNAETCIENFTTEGNMWVGRTYKTWAELPGVERSSAFAQAQSFTAENGFTILSADAGAGVISAAQSVSYSKGKSAPLSITMRAGASGALRVSLSFVNYPGSISPEDAVRRHFCLTLAAMGQAAAEGSPGVATRGSTAPAVAVAGTAAVTAPGFARQTPAQAETIRALMPMNVPNKAVGALVTEASPAISEFIGRVACIADHRAATSLDEWAAPNKNLGTLYMMMHPMRTARYHSKTACLSVSRIHGWTMPAANALEFEVIYKSDQSGEVAKLRHEAVRQPDGTWLFNR